MYVILGILFGLALFLYGMKIMGQGLQKAAGDKLKNIIKALTGNIIIGVLIGTLVTSIIQSSSATTVMVVGFVNAGIMNLSQAVGVIFGANIGTTITGQMISFDLTKFAPIALGIGVSIYLFSKKEKNKNIGEILVGFSILFIGMELMKNSISPLAQYDIFKEMLINFGKYPMLGLLMGLLTTAILQSSSAASGILIALASQGLLPVNSALYMLYGQNIGTCVTAMIASIGTSKNAKRAAIIHLMFNVIGSIIFMVFFNKLLINIVVAIDPTNVARQIANVHTLFNVGSVILLLPFANHMVKLSEKICK